MRNTQPRQPAELPATVSPSPGLTQPTQFPPAASSRPAQPTQTQQKPHPCSCSCEVTPQCREQWHPHDNTSTRRAGGISEHPPMDCKAATQEALPSSHARA